MDARRGVFADFTLATAVLTRIPIGVAEPEPGAIAAAAWSFPLVGAGVGGIAALVFFTLEVVGLGATPAALLAIVAGVAVTGALHEDGLADTADGFGGGRDRTQKLVIMRDSRQGSYGILALAASLGLRAAAIASTPDPISAGLALVAAHAASRGLLPVAMRTLAPARADGLGATAGRPSPAGAAIAALIGAAIALAALGPFRGLVALAIAGFAVALTALLAQRQIGGYTGDVLGAFQQIGEIAMLLVAAAK
jgi:adenosylcobinamide-GDP ribazoletransferase